MHALFVAAVAADVQKSQNEKTSRRRNASGEIEDCYEAFALVDQRCVSETNENKQNKHKVVIMCRPFHLCLNRRFFSVSLFRVTSMTIFPTRSHSRFCLIINGIIVFICALSQLRAARERCRKESALRSRC